MLPELHHEIVWSHDNVTKVTYRYRLSSQIFETSICNNLKCFEGRSHVYCKIHIVRGTNTFSKGTLHWISSSLRSICWGDVKGLHPSFLPLNWTVCTQASVFIQEHKTVLQFISCLSTVSVCQELIETLRGLELSGKGWGETHNGEGYVTASM